MASVREGLGLSSNQEKQLHAISAAYSAIEPWRRANSREHAGVIKDVRQKVDAVLTPKQLAALKEIVYRSTIYNTCFVFGFAQVGMGRQVSPELIKEIQPTKQQLTVLEGDD